MPDPLKQFVPSEVCLKCDGCCRFKEHDSSWRPKISPEEVELAKSLGLAEKIFSQDVIGQDHYIRTAPGCGEHLCSFFNSQDHTCAIYQSRPFECELYPFVISRDARGAGVYVHLNCPHVEAEYRRDHEHVAYLKEYFARPQVRDYLVRNQSLLTDYSAYKDELEFLFPIEGLANAKSAELLKHKKLFDQFAAQSSHSLSVYHFSSIFLWQDYFEFSFEIIDDALCVWAKYSFGTFLYLPPLGKTLDPKTVEKCFERLHTVNTRKGVGRIENMAKDEISLLDGKTYKSVLKSNEYYYRREDLAELKGNAYKSKRSSYNQFVKNHDHEFVAFDRKWAGDCLKLYDAWAENRAERSEDDIYKVMLEENRGVHALIFEYFDELGLEGRVVLVDQKVQAYSFGYFLNADTFCVLVETVNLELKGLSVYIFNRFCTDHALKDFKYINAMDDFAMDNVARTKDSFKPAFLIPSYTVTQQ